MPTPMSRDQGGAAPLHRGVATGSERRRQRWPGVSFGLAREPRLAVGLTTLSVQVAQGA